MGNDAVYLDILGITRFHVDYVFYSGTKKSFIYIFSPKAFK